MKFFLIVFSIGSLFYNIGIFASTENRCVRVNWNPVARALDEIQGTRYADCSLLAQKKSRDIEPYRYSIDFPVVQSVRCSDSAQVVTPEMIASLLHIRYMMLRVTSDSACTCNQSELDLLRLYQEKYVQAPAKAVTMPQIWCPGSDVFACSGGGWRVDFQDKTAMLFTVNQTTKKVVAGFFSADVQDN